MDILMREVQALERRVESVAALGEVDRAAARGAHCGAAPRGVVHENRVIQLMKKLGAAGARRAGLSGALARSVEVVAAQQYRSSQVLRRAPEAGRPVGHAARRHGVAAADGDQLLAGQGLSQPAAGAVPAVARGRDLLAHRAARALRARHPARARGRRRLVVVGRGGLPRPHRAAPRHHPRALRGHRAAPAVRPRQHRGARAALRHPPPPPRRAAPLRGRHRRRRRRGRDQRRRRWLRRSC